MFIVTAILFARVAHKSAHAATPTDFTKLVWTTLGRLLEFTLIAGVCPVAGARLASSQASLNLRVHRYGHFVREGCQQICPRCYAHGFHKACPDYFGDVAGACPVAGAWLAFDQASLNLPVHRFGYFVCNGCQQIRPRCYDH